MTRVPAQLGSRTIPAARPRGDGCWARSSAIETEQPELELAEF